MHLAKNRELTFVPTSPQASFLGEKKLQSTAYSTTSPRRRRLTHRTSKRQCPALSIHFLEPAYALPEFINHLVMSCGIGLAGIAGAKATEEARALTAGDQKAERMDELARDIDSLRRRKELANVSRERDWDDVGVDRYANVVVEPEVVPELESHDDLEAFDKLLMDAPAAKRMAPKKRFPDVHMRLPDPAEFEFEDDD